MTAVLKLSSVLAVCALVLSQMGTSYAVPLRPGSELVTDQGTLSEYEARRLLNAMLNEYLQLAAEDREQASEGKSASAQKRSCNTSTCVTQRLADFLSRSGGVGNEGFVPTDVGSTGFGRRRRNVQM
uniref:Calcitonin related polypeptide beta n=1 Tax=Varanus komodoensis TaxID=61221 RepID=A0A8D2L5S6_VARKO